VKKLLEKDDNRWVVGESGTSGKREVSAIEREKEKIFIELVNSGSFKGREEIDEDFFGAPPVDDPVQDENAEEGSSSSSSSSSPEKTKEGVRQSRYKIFPRNPHLTGLQSDYYRSVMFTVDVSDDPSRGVDGMLASYAHTIYSSAVITSFFLLMSDNVNLMSEHTYKGYSIVCDYILKMVNKFKEEEGRLKLMRNITKPNPSASSAQPGSVLSGGQEQAKKVPPPLQMDKLGDGRGGYSYDYAGGGGGGGGNGVEKARPSNEEDKFLEKNFPIIQKKVVDMFEAYFDGKMSVDAFVDQFKTWKQLFYPSVNASAKEKKGGEEGKGGEEEEESPTPPPTYTYTGASEEETTPTRVTTSVAPSFPWVDFFCYHMIIDHFMLELNYIQNYTSHNKRQVCPLFCLVFFVSLFFYLPCYSHLFFFFLYLFFF
jgi:hypothetical protein